VILLDTEVGVCKVVLSAPSICPSDAQLL